VLGLSWYKEARRLGGNQVVRHQFSSGHPKAAGPRTVKGEPERSSIIWAWHWPAGGTIVQAGLIVVVLREPEVGQAVV